jgi:hypothetical protein
MAAGNIAETIASLTPEQQQSVMLFVEFLKRKDSTPSSRSSPFLGAVDEFVEQHPRVASPSGSVTSYPNIDEVVTVHVSQNHPFLDGNKRVAVTVTAAFLKVNGYKLAVA